MRRGAGAYICGEEILGCWKASKANAMPRHKPPLPVPVGLFGLPTLINNIETLWVGADIVEKGADWWKSMAATTARSAQLFGAGRVKNPGIEAGAGRHYGARIDRVLRRSQRTYLPRLPAGGASGGILRHRWTYSARFRTLEKYGCFIGSAAVIILSSRIA